MPAPTTNDTTAKNWGRASIVSSLLLLPAAAFQLDLTFWVLVASSFALMHAVWLVQLAECRDWGAVDFGLVKWPLIAFAVPGNVALFLWGGRLQAALPV